MNTAEKRWQRAIVVGASSGIGEALARRLAGQGVSVVLVARREDRLSALASELNNLPGSANAFPLVHDVTDTVRAAAVLQEAALKLGGLDLVVYAAGIMPRIAPNDYPTSIDLATLATNLNGAIAWLNVAADRFTRAGEGTIVGISSVAGDRGRAANPVYNAGKAALNSYLESLRNRLARHGVSVVTVKPGYVRTPLLDGYQFPTMLMIDADVAADLILKAAAEGRRIAYIPGWWRLIMLVIRLIPAPIMERVNI